jgi:hypothetical protein
VHAFRVRVEGARREAVRLTSTPAPLAVVFGRYS